MSLLERIRKFINKRGYDEVLFDAMPVVQVNDDFTEQVQVFNAERTSTGTTALTTTPSGRTQTFITSLTLTGSCIQIPAG